MAPHDERMQPDTSRFWNGAQEFEIEACAKSWRQSSKDYIPAAVFGSSLEEGRCSDRVGSHHQDERKPFRKLGDKPLEPRAEVPASRVLVKVDHHEHLASVTWTGHVPAFYSEPRSGSLRHG